MPTDTFLDHKPFLSDSFDVHSYTNAILQGRQYTPDQPQQNNAKEDNDKADPDVSAELARLNYGIEDVTKQLRQEITASHLLLLNHLTTSLSLSSHLSPIRSSLISLSASIDRLHSKIHTPYTNLSTLVRRQQNLRQIKDIARRASRFVIVARRLETQLERMGNAPEEDGEKDKTERRGELAKAALSCAELDSLLKDQSNEPGDDTSSIRLLDIDFVRAYSPLISRARDTVIEEMETMVFTGLQELNQTLLSSALQTAHNLRLLPDLVSNLLDDLNDAVTLRVTKAFDVSAIGKERLERVMDDVANCCIKVYTLEKVLRVKRDTLTQVEFFDEVMKRLDEKPSFTYWTTLAKAFETQTKEAAKSSSWLQQALSVGYPKLLRLFHDFFSRIAVHTDTVYTQEHQSPEAVLVLRSISSFETLYLSRSTNRMGDVVASAVEQYLSARGNPPGPSDGVSVARTMTNELDSARFDPLLVRTVARNAAKILDGFIQTLDGMLIEDFTATSLIGPNATSAQQVNAQLVGCLYHCWLNLAYIEYDHTGKVWEILSPSINSLETTYRRITNSLDVAFRKEIISTLARIHRVNFNTSVDPLAMGMDARGGSPYMQDLVDKIGFVRSQIMGRMSLGEYMKAWVLDLSKFILRTFLLHASITRPMGESGALKLTGDMTELEMGVTNLLSTGKIQGTKDSVKVEQVGDEYVALRTFRTLLFANLESLANPVETVHIPPLIVLHHIIVRSPLLLPHEFHGWSESEYVLWIEKHKDEKEQWELVERTVEDQHVTHNEEEMKVNIYVKLIKEILAHARHDEQLSA
ncbi:hypothetical protein I305_06443 [Cryptococcus gattii E566]|uniref:Conserved oligomeric Golgi complex subunit 5 n=2 Tax=Cryptococcus gattii TaxID=37769 RepID=E6R3B4_CRYGW|nr:Hypothetical Protein CGB_C3660C [Cryptococcus gattii WM276]ADV21425.1 Hypothetical Protein CGB_C3660C [Cryptococcus gattii WM276]KIR82152.1 hypothetical protein I306_00796 [Cryptococcus gattii EJB2]KIY31154.1 hypothetical protein I305_06443 [Cryptococcus gattii E566]KJE02097.1 hypothetical protein I311_04305 [Cryptococcus gattii NT-10]